MVPKRRDLAGFAIAAALVFPACGSHDEESYVVTWSIGRRGASGWQTLTCEEAGVDTVGAATSDDARQAPCSDGRLELRPPRKGDHLCVGAEARTGLPAFSLTSIGSCHRTFPGERGYAASLIPMTDSLQLAPTLVASDGSPLPSPSCELAGVDILEYEVRDGFGAIWQGQLGCVGDPEPIHVADVVHDDLVLRVRGVKAAEPGTAADSCDVRHRFETYVYGAVPVSLRTPAEPCP